MYRLWWIWQRCVLTGDERISIAAIAELTPGSGVAVQIQPERSDPCRIDTQDELRFFRHGGILPCRLREMIVEFFNQAYNLNTKANH